MSGKVRFTLEENISSRSIQDWAGIYQKHGIVKEYLNGKGTKIMEKIGNIVDFNTMDTIN